MNDKKDEKAPEANQAGGAENHVGATRSKSTDANQRINEGNAGTDRTGRPVWRQRQNAKPSTSQQV